MKSPYIWTIIVVMLLCINSVMLIMLWKERKPLPPAGQENTGVQAYLTKELSLTARQVSQFDSLRNLHRVTADSLNDKIHTLRNRLFGGIAQPATDPVITNDIAQQIGNNSALIDKATFYHFRKLRELLTAGQQKKFDNIIDRVLHMMARQGPPEGPGGRPPEGPPDRRPEGPPPPGN